MHLSPFAALLLPIAIGSAAPRGGVRAQAAPAAAPVAAPRATGADPVLDRVLALAREDNRVDEHLRTLCKTIGPRLTGTKGYDRAAQWAVERFRSFGLEARLEEWGEFPSAFERGYASGGMVAPERIDYTIHTPAWSPGTGGVKRGRAVLEPASEEELLAAKASLAGAWMVSRDPAPPGKVRRMARQACEELGALGVVSPGSRNGRLHGSGNHRVEAEKVPRQARILLLHAQHADLLSRLEAGEVVELEFEVGNVLSPGPVACTNVVAELKGAEHPDEFVVVGGHLDSWDAAEGAQDDAAGCASAIEAARLIAAAGGRPRRTIRFVLFGGEEQGLLGSKGYVKVHADEMERTSLALIHDGGSTPLVGLSTTYAMIEDFEEVFAPLEGIEPAFPFRLEETDGLENTGDSDHAPFLEAGVPGFFWRQSERGYERVHHTQFDVLESIDLAEMRHSARVVAVAAWGFAQLDHPLDRTDAQAVPRRRMGITLEGASVRRVFEGSQAAAAGWEEGDRILSIDGVEVEDRERITALLRQGGGKKSFRLKRGEAVVPSTLDWSNEDSEKERGERAARREAWLRARARSSSR